MTTPSETVESAAPTTAGRESAGCRGTPAFVVRRQTGKLMNLTLIAIACGLVAVLYGIFTSRQVLAASPGNQRMIDIPGAIQEGAQAYLGRHAGPPVFPNEEGFFSALH